MGEICTDNRFDIIAKAKEDLLKSTNIETRPEEMAVIDNILFRCWQMGWLNKYKDNVSIEHYKLSEEEVIVARFNCYDFSYDELSAWHKILQGAFGENKVISIPQNILLEQMSKAQLKDFLNKITTEFLNNKNEGNIDE